MGACKFSKLSVLKHFTTPPSTFIFQNIQLCVPGVVAIADDDPKSIVANGTDEAEDSSSSGTLQ